ncbi:MAG: haloacid dehalogenase [Oscillibacter sp.]|jgi:hydroxymethylpyrimidine pyrophosphatase-like HAD family hydrolase|nr:haloacid dehalogenase [Oscillibacter sp.]
MRRLLFASDLDNTLLFSHRHARSGDICVERLEGREQGFMTPWVWETLGRLPEGVRLLPVTTRSIEQYRRIRWPEGHAPEYAVTTNGGIFLGPKGLDPAWLAASRALVEAWQEELARMYAWLPERPWCLRRKMVDGLYLFAVCPEETDMKAAAAECRRTAALAAEPSGRKLYLLPPGLDKGTAVEKACGFFDADVLICAGDSSLDLPMLRLADLALVPDMALGGQLAALSCAPAEQREIRVCPQGVRFSEFVLTQVLKAAEALLNHSEYTRNGVDGGRGN